MGNAMRGGPSWPAELKTGNGRVWGDVNSGTLWPVEQLWDWVARKNRPQTAAELEAIGISRYG